MSRPPAPIHVEVLSGALRGGSFRFEPGSVVIGRAADCSLRFDPDQDLDVSSHHAMLVLEPFGWTVEDLGSTNGTLVNRTPVSEPTLLKDGDVVAFGLGGPQVRIRLQASDTAHSVAAGLSTPAASATESTSVPDRRSSIPWGMAALWSFVALTILGVFWVGRANQRTWASERTLLMSRVDSLLAAQSATEQARASALAQLSDSLGLAREEVQDLRSRLAAATSDDSRADVEELERQLQEAAVRLERQQLATTLDFDAIRRQVEPAVAMIWSEFADGTVLTGTAVSIGPDGTLLTNRHVVRAADGMEADRFAVQFAGSPQVWRATLLRTHQSADLAWARAEGIVGDVPRLDRVNAQIDTLSPGSPVAVVGFPLGGQPGAASPGARRRAVVSAGLLLERRPDELRIQGYGAEGASGSPVVDRDGRMIGLVYGAESETGILLAVPIGLARQDR